MSDTSWHLTVETAPRDVGELCKLTPFHLRWLARDAGALQTEEEKAAWHRPANIETHARRALAALVHWDEEHGRVSSAASMMSGGTSTTGGRASRLRGEAPSLSAREAHDSAAVAADVWRLLQELLAEHRGTVVGVGPDDDLIANTAERVMSKLVAEEAAAIGIVQSLRRVLGPRPAPSAALEGPRRAGATKVRLS